MQYTIYKFTEHSVWFTTNHYQQATKLFALAHLDANKVIGLGRANISLHFVVAHELLYATKQVAIQNLTRYRSITLMQVINLYLGHDQSVLLARQYQGMFGHFASTHKFILPSVTRTTYIPVVGISRTTDTSASHQRSRIAFRHANLYY